MTRRGFTLMELLIGMVVFAILATALARLIISNSRFVSRQEVALDARQTARAAMAVVVPELRMVSDGGLLAAAPDSITVRVPYAFGVLCTGAYAVLAPPDSTVYATAVPGGIAYQLSSGAYEFDTTVTVIGTTTQTYHCDVDSIRAIPGGKRITLSVADLAPSGRLFYLFQTITFKFASSSALPGRRALWRRAGSAAAEELLAPFDTSARFAFLVGSRLSVQTAVPSPLSDTRGIELRFAAQSVATAQGAGAPDKFSLYPRVLFENALIQ
jgi:prepilin-type N-terminal cleavage/methylation domain-containing protein